MNVNPSAMKWQCGRCSHWNKIENGKCASCSALSQQFATAFRLHNVLTAEESNFYKGTAPQILRELRTIRLLIEDITKTKEEREMEEGRAGELLQQIWEIEAKVTKMMNENRGASLDKKRPVHSYDVIAKIQQEKEKLIEERRELLIGQSTTQQKNKTQGFTITDNPRGEAVQGSGQGLQRPHEVQQVLGESKAPQEAPPEDGKPLTESEQIIAAIKSGNVAEILQKQAVSPENIIPLVKPNTKRTNKLTARQKLAEEIIKLLDLIEKYYKQ